METLASIIGYGILAMFCLAGLLGLLFLLMQVLSYLPLMLCAATGLFCLGLPFYLVHQYDSWWYACLMIVTFPVGWKAFEWADKADPNSPTFEN